MAYATMLGNYIRTRPRAGESEYRLSGFIIMVVGSVLVQPYDNSMTG